MLIQINEALINIVHHYVVTKLTANEGIVYSGTISGCVNKVFAEPFGERTYTGIEDRAGAILYSIVHGHSFTDGNKRTGLLTTCLFLFFNGKPLIIPEDCAKFLEKMADAKNPNAPTEKDAIVWIRKNTQRSIFASVTNFFFTWYCKTKGWASLEELTKIILENDILPFVNQEKLVDRQLLETRRQKWKDRSCDNGSKSS